LRSPSLPPPDELSHGDQDGRPVEALAYVVGQQRDFGIAGEQR
jgi:hypothetical protein